MNGQPVDRWEARLRATASVLPYPSTPDVAGAVRRRLRPEPGDAEPARPAGVRRPQLAWAIAILAIVLASLLAVPQVRAALLEFLRIGAVRIYLVAPTPTATPKAPAPVSTGAPFLPTATPRPTATLLPSLLDLAGETTFEKAQARFGSTIPLPAYPADLRPPDHVFAQDFGGPVVVLVWMEPQRPDRVRLSLHLLACEVCATKAEPTVIQTTSVNGQPAVWTEGPYLIRLSNGNTEMRRLIEGHVLIWTNGPITYRLETDLPLEEAVRIAESVK